MKSFYSAVFGGDVYDESQIAIIDGDCKYTYAELKVFVDTKADIINGFKPPKNSSIAIVLEKSMEYVVWQLACSKLSCAFMPLDVTHGERNKRIFEVHQPFLEIHEEEIKTSQNYDVVHDRCGYVVFSSGSTGAPKGMMLNTESAVDIIRQQAKIIGIRDGSVCLWILNPGFDASLADIYGALMSGATLCIAREGARKIKTWLGLIHQHRVTHIDMPPSLFNAFEKTNGSQLNTLQCIVFGGETAPEKTAKALSKRFKLFQAYGPSETTICASMNEVCDSWEACDLGTPLGGIMFKVVESELHIGGSCVGLGYFKNNKNQSRFYTLEGVHWYKTGDVVEEVSGRYLFKGRLDRQIKRHGQLVCPEEIEIVALGCGASYAHISLGDGIDKLTLNFSGPLSINELEEKLPVYLRPNFYEKIEFKLEERLSANDKITHK